MPQQKTPIGVIDIVAASWRNLAVNIRIYLEFTAWTTAIGTTLWVISSLIGGAVTDPTVAGMTVTVISIPFSLALMTVTLAMIHATWQCLNRKETTVRESMVVGLKMLVPFVWLSFLTGLVFLAVPASILGLGYLVVGSVKVYLAQYFWLYVTAVALTSALVGATVIVPIYYLLPIYFSADYLTIDGLRGWACLKRCTRLVRGRWWKVFWRLVVPGIFFWLVIRFAVKLAYLIIGSLLGDPGMLFGVITGGGPGSLARGTLILTVAEVIYGIVAPLFVGANLIVWDNLKRSEGQE